YFEIFWLKTWKREMLAKIVIFLIKSYKLFLSPVLPPSCSFFPSCSTYFQEAVAKYGVVRGGLLGVRRLLKCNPFHKGGVDLLP
ncbi:MAG: membrane protein insertion efficiency factor YidD, partial [Nitrospinota bacterium]